MSLSKRALGVAVGLLLDRALGEPPDAWHPVAWFGRAMGRVEDATYADEHGAGARYALVGAGLGACAGALLGRLGTVGLAVAVGTASAGRMLRHTSAQIEELLVHGDLGGARERLPWLVGRDPSHLDESGVAAAVVESLAENTVDAVVAPAFWGLVAGAPGVLVHRAVNTMDAMVGHRSARYARFGTVAARADDVMAWVPARVFAGVVALDASVGTSGQHSDGGDVLRAVRRYASAHPSPNAGVAESAVAGALGVQLGGPLRYGDRVEDRPVLGDGPRARPDHIRLARRLVDQVELMLVGLAVAGWVLDGISRRRA